MGKTYSALRRMIVDKQRFIYMRRTKDQLMSIMDSAKGEGLNPFIDLNTDMGTSWGISRQSDKIGLICEREMGDKGIWTPKSSPVGYALALSAIATMKGIGAQACDYWIYDEFIPEPHEPAIKKECNALLSAYDSLCSNRELKGERAIRMLMLANSTDIYNPILKGLGLVLEAEKMQARGIRHKRFPAKKLTLHLLEMSSELKEARANTAVMLLAAGTDYADMALGNTFSYNDFSLCEYKNLKGYRPVCMVDDFYVYNKKGSPELHCSYARADVGQRYSTKNQHDYIAFKREYGALIDGKYPKGLITFESYEIKAAILNLVYGGFK